MGLSAISHADFLVHAIRRITLPANRRIRSRSQSSIVGRIAIEECQIGMRRAMKWRAGAGRERSLPGF
jgi:hypothetical protein